MEAKKRTIRKGINEIKHMERPVEVIFRGGQFKQFTEQELAGLRKEYNLKRIELEVVHFLSICGKYDTVANIHEYLSANKGHISQTVFSLCKRGYVVAEQDKKDRRYVHYSLTKEGEALAGEISEVWDRIRQEMFEGVSEEELECFKRVSARVCLLTTAWAW